MKKRLFSLLLIVLCIVAVPTARMEAVENRKFETPITLTVNKTLVDMDTDPFLYRGTTFVPIRFVSGALGAETIRWNGATSTATIICSGKEIALTKGKDTALVNGKTVKVAEGVIIYDDRLFVPVRFVTENLDCQVNWIFDTYTVDIQKDGVRVPGEYIGSRAYTDDEIYWLSKIIHAESQGEPMAGKVAVGNVILNRVESRDYPNTIYGVIFDRKNGVQFSPVLDGSIYQKPLGDSVIAAKLALEGEEIAGRSLFFLNPKTAQSNWIVKNRPYYMTIRNHEFYL